MLIFSVAGVVRSRLCDCSESKLRLSQGAEKASPSLQWSLHSARPNHKLKTIQCTYSNVINNTICFTSVAAPAWAFLHNKKEKRAREFPNVKWDTWIKEMDMQDWESAQGGNVLCARVVTVLRKLSKIRLVCFCQHPAWSFVHLSSSRPWVWVQNVCVKDPTPGRGVIGSLLSKINLNSTATLVYTALIKIPQGWDSRIISHSMKLAGSTAEWMGFPKTRKTSICLQYMQ